MPVVLKEVHGNSSFQLSITKKVDNHEGETSIRDAQQVKLRGTNDLLKKIQTEKEVLDKMFEDVSKPKFEDPSMFRRKGRQSGGRKSASSNFRQSIMNVFR